MKTHFFALFLFLAFFSCKKNQEKTTANWEKISQNIQIKQDSDQFNLRSGKFNYSIPEDQLPFKKVILLNASLVGYFTQLGLENTLIGISSPEYVYSDKIHQLISESKIQNIGNEQKYDVEKIIALKPDVIFTNYISTFDNTYDLLKKNGIEVIFLDEYLEQNPLEKSKYLLVFGKLFDEEKLAETQFNEISKNYQSLQKLAKTGKTQPVVLANEMYGNQWFLPGGKSNLAQLISDANAKYINANVAESKAIPMSFEEVYAKSQEANFWVNAGNHNKKSDLLRFNPAYAKMNVFQNGKIYTITGKEKDKSNDYFESGVVRTDLILKDFIKIFHPDLLPDYHLTYLKELK